jgi:betaine-homocysteine S-methyltransferase
VRWSKEEGADYIIAETIPYLGEAEIALEVILSHDLPAVVAMSVLRNPAFETLDGVHIGRACRTLLDKGATIVGSNCYRGPNTMLDVVKEIVKEVPPEKVCALPVMYRTTVDEPTFFDFNDKCCPVNNPVYPHGMDAFQVSTREVAEFTKRCKDMGLKYMGLCCGNTGNYTRAMADALGKRPPASKYLDPDNRGINPELRKQELKK